MERNPKAILAATILFENEGEVVIQVRGTSMLPLLWPRARVRIRRCQAKDVNVGDPILRILNDHLVLHRAIRRFKTTHNVGPQGLLEDDSDIEDRREDREKYLWMTQGDANPCPDPPCSEEEILGRVESPVWGRFQAPVPPHWCNLPRRWLSRPRCQKALWVAHKILLRAHSYWPRMSYKEAF